MAGTLGQTGDWNRYLRQRPSAITVAHLARLEGLETCRERWPSLHPRTIASLVRQGNRQLELRSTR